MQIESRQYIGNLSGSTELFNSSNKADFDNIYACVMDILGTPTIVQILTSTPNKIIQAIQRMLWEVNANVKISYVDSLDDAADESPALGSSFDGFFSVN